MDLLPGATPWTILTGFVVALGTTIIIGIRALMQGKLVPSNIHNEVRADRDTYRAATETALAANRELAGSVTQLVSANQGLTGSVNQLIATVDKLATITYENQTVMRQLVTTLQSERDRG